MSIRVWGRSFARIATGFVAGFAMFAGVSAVAEAGVVVNVDLANQRMNVVVNGAHYATYKISSGRRGYTTPTGRYRVQRMETMHYSRKYHNSPMPHSVFFRGGFAIHGTGAISRLGRVASHGCVRLHPSNAAALYSLIKANGSRSTSIRLFYGAKSRVAQSTRKYKKKAKKTYSARKARSGWRARHVADNSPRGRRTFYFTGGIF